jgi:hypothetical protein
MIGGERGRLPRLIGDGRGRWGGVKEGVGCRKIRLIESNAKCRYLKKFTCEGTLRQVFICLSPILAIGKNCSLVSFLLVPCSYMTTPEMEFLDISLTKDSSLLLHAIHSPFYWRIKKTLLCFQNPYKKSGKQENLSLFMNSIV